MKNKNERGQSLVELAISLVVLLYLLSGATEFALAFFQFVQLRDAAQEGALYGSLNPDDSAGIISRVRNSSNSPLDLSINDVNTGATVTVNFPDGDSCEGDGIEVVVRHDHAIFMPFMKQILNRQYITLTARVTDTILYQSC
jgi:hypothetical protein